MKKFTQIIVPVLLIFILVSCEKQSGELTTDHRIQNTVSYEQITQEYLSSIQRVEQPHTYTTTGFWGNL